MSSPALWSAGDFLRVKSEAGGHPFRKALQSPASCAELGLLQIAIKFIPRGPSTITKHVEREIINHSNFCHPHVVQVQHHVLIFCSSQPAPVLASCRMQHPAQHSMHAPC